jgi:hypothetical protein
MEGVPSDRVSSLRRRRSRRYLILAFVLGLLYLFLFPQPFGREGFFKPVWSRPIPAPQGPAAPTSAAQAPESGQAGEERRLSWFKAGRHFGFVRLDGQVQYAAEALHGVALSELGFINYPRVADNFVFQDTAGRFQYAVRGYGYPILDPGGELLFSVSTDLTELKHLDRDGEVLWSAGFFSPITALALSGGECAVGLLDGTVKLLEAGGRIAQDFLPEPSRIPVILGVALAPGRLAVLSGIDPQRLTILERRGGQFAPVQTLATGADLRREALMHFSADGRFLAYETDTGLALRDLRRGAASELPGRLLALGSDGDGLLALGCREGGGSRLRLLRPLSSVLYERPLPAGDLFLRFLDRSLLIGFPGRLLRADYLEE